jgi:hypothetical protein
MGDQFAENVKSIDTNLTRLADENRRLRALLAEVALLVACQPQSRHTERWLKEAEELRCG